MGENCPINRNNDKVHAQKPQQTQQQQPQTSAAPVPSQTQQLPPNQQQSRSSSSPSSAPAITIQQVATAQTQPNQRFADYFVICGLDLDTGLEPDRFAGMQCIIIYLWPLTRFTTFLLPPLFILCSDVWCLLCIYLLIMAWEYYFPNELNVQVHSIS